MPFHIEYQNLHNDSYAQQKRFGNPRSLFTVFAVHSHDCIAAFVLHGNNGDLNLIRLGGYYFVRSVGLGM